MARPSIWPVLARSRVGLAVRRVSPGAYLVTRPRVAARHRAAQEKNLGRYLLGGHVVRLLEKYRVTCVLDVGANTGQYAQRLRRFGYTGHIVSFAPVGAVFAELERRAGKDPRWTAHRLALGRDDGTIDIHVAPVTSYSSVLPPTQYGRRRYRSALTDQVTEPVAVRRLDGLLDEVLPASAGRRLYLKMDTQGYDLEVFAGLGGRTGEVVALQSELALVPLYEGMPRLPEALAVYEAAGFEVAGLCTVTRERTTARVLEFDCVMVRAPALRGTGPAPDQPRR